MSRLRKKLNKLASESLLVEKMKNAKLIELKEIDSYDEVVEFIGIFSIDFDLNSIDQNDLKVSMNYNQLVKIK
jgi:hypothetical protein